MQIDVDFPGGLAVNASFGDFTVKTDQAKAVGGGGTAPSPFELFLSSIAACAGYYALAFCREREISTQGMKLSASFEKSPETKTLATADLTLTLPTGFPEKYVKPIIRTMEQCTVKRAIAAQPLFTINVS